MFASSNEQIESIEISKDHILFRPLGSKLKNMENKIRYDNEHDEPFRHSDSVISNPLVNEEDHQDQMDLEEKLFNKSTGSKDILDSVIVERILQEMNES